MPHRAALPAPTDLRKPGTTTRSPGLRRWRIRTRAQPCPTAPRRLPDGCPTAPRRLTGSKAQQHRQHPQRPQLHPGARSRAEPRHTVPNAGMRDPWGSTALLFLGRDPPLCPAQPTEAPPRAPPYSQRGLDLSPNNSDPTPHYNAFSGKIVDQAREANIG